MQPLPTTTTTDPDLAELITRMDEAADAYMRGDIRRYLQLIPNAPDCSLMPPYGGGPLSTAGRTEADIDATSAYFRNGEATIEVYAAHRSGDLAVLVLIERQHGEVGGTSDQDWSLRITLVFRRDDEQWLLVHDTRTRWFIPSTWSRPRPSPAAETPTSNAGPPTIGSLPGRWPGPLQRRSRDPDTHQETPAGQADR